MGVALAVVPANRRAHAHPGAADALPGAVPRAGVQVFPNWLSDLSCFLLAAALVLPLLMFEVDATGPRRPGPQAATNPRRQPSDRLTVASARRRRLKVPIRRSLAVLGRTTMSNCGWSGGRSLLHAARLDGLAAQLPPGFLRVHRSVIANLSQVQRLDDGDRWRLHSSEGAPLPVSRSRQPALREAMDAPPPVLCNRTIAIRAPSRAADHHSPIPQGFTDPVSVSHRN